MARWAGDYQFLSRRGLSSAEIGLLKIRLRRRRAVVWLAWPSAAICLLASLMLMAYPEGEWAGLLTFPACVALSLIAIDSRRIVRALRSDLADGGIEEYARDDNRVLILPGSGSLVGEDLRPVVRIRINEVAERPVAKSALTFPRLIEATAGGMVNERQLSAEEAEELRKLSSRHRRSFAGCFLAYCTAFALSSVGAGLDPHQRLRLLIGIPLVIVAGLGWHSIIREWSFNARLRRDAAACRVVASPGEIV
ncbi:MAG TPA: hypothetical protein VMI31_14370, partial [Fimbriimonadaceae bacterium]|nr:hypothetical protein [Fimbriimonadaceae bacterium]